MAEQKHVNELLMFLNNAGTCLCMADSVLYSGPFEAGQSERVALVVNDASISPS